MTVLGVAILLMVLVTAFFLRRPTVREGGFCLDCGHQVDSFEGLNGCPACGRNNIPCAHRDQVTVSINWHELHVLVVWAENWQRVHVPNTKAVYGIAKRLEVQHPKNGPLTLAGELGEVAKHFGGLGVTDPDLRRDIAEQTGEEPELFT